VTDWLDRPLLELDSVDLDGAGSVTYLLHQVFRYSYDGPVYQVRQRLVALPRLRHGNLHRRARHVVVTDAEGSAYRPVTHRDADGNEVVAVELPVVASAVADPRLLVPTRLTSPSPELWDLAESLRSAHDADAALAEELCRRLRSEFTFDVDATTVATTAAEAYALRRGVCQDIAHVMLTVCRLAGIPARYVSGHLLGEQGGSHAWVEVLVPDGPGARALAFDPTNGRRAGGRHLPVAVGRDYVDVAPTSGVYTGTARGELTWTKRAGITAA
jgi:transglutaminase-like putative cysteine protease